MKVIPHITITDAMLTSSTAAEPGAGETLWNVGTAYSVAQTCYLATTHRRYECLIAHTGASPDVNLTGTTPKWLELGPTNKWSMFDTLRNTATTVTSPLTVVIALDQRIDSLALIGLVGTSATITMTVGATTVYSYTTSLTLRNTLTWSGYYFGTFGQQKALVRFDLPPYASAVLTITITGTTVACGGVVLGTAVDIGKTQYNPVSGALNFSRIDRDVFGNAVLLQRRSVPRTDQTLLADKAKVNKIIEVRESLNAVPALWSGLDDKDTHGYFDAVLIFGIYKEFSISLDYPDYAKVTLQLEEI
jgi:hypothetical protein